MVDLLKDPTYQVGNETVTIEKEAVPMNLRTMVYSDAKKVAKSIGKFVVAGILLVLLYHYFGIWGFATFSIMFVISYKWLIPTIAEKFMTYVNLVTIELGHGKADEIKIVQLSHARFQRAIIIDDCSRKAALNAPFMSVLGMTYLVDRIEVGIILRDPNTGNPIPDLADIPIDVIRVHPVHKNVEFVRDYEPEFIALRMDYMNAIKELFALKTRLEIMVIERSNDKTFHVLQMIQDVFEAKPQAEEDYEGLKADMKIIKELLELGLNMESTANKKLITNIAPVQPPVPSLPGGQTA